MFPRFTPRGRRCTLLLPPPSAVGPSVYSGSFAISGYLTHSMDYLTKIAEALRSVGLLHSDIEKISDQIETATSEYKAHNNKEQSLPAVNAVLHRPQAEIDNKEARATRHETRDVDRLRIERWGLAVGAIVAFVTFGQLFLTSRAVRIASISATAAQSSAKASAQGVDATKQSIEATINQFHLDQRAWLAIKPDPIVFPKLGGNFQPTPGVDPHISAILNIQNTGKTPARRIKGWARLRQTHTRSPRSHLRDHLAHQCSPVPQKKPQHCRHRRHCRPRPLTRI
jgi:hypothetical protein